MTLSASGVLWVAGTYTNSDRRVKSEIRPADRQKAQAAFDLIDIYTYLRPQDNEPASEDAEGNAVPAVTAKRRIGFISNEVKAAVEASGLDVHNLTGLSPEGNGIVTLGYDRMISLLWAVVKNQQADLKTAAGLIEELTTRVENLEME